MKLFEPLIQSIINKWYTVYSPFYNSAMDLDEPANVRVHLIRKLDIKNNEKILEVGAGTGRNIRHYPCTPQIYCTDLNKSMLKIAKKEVKKLDLENIILKKEDAKNISFEDNTFDVGIMTYALAGIPNKKKALSEMKRVIKQKGRIGILDFNYVLPVLIGGNAGINLKRLISNNPDLKIIHHIKYPRCFSQSIYVLENNKIV